MFHGAETLNGGRECPRSKMYKHEIVIHLQRDN